MINKKIGHRYTPWSLILSNWVSEGSLGKCPKCTLPVIRIIETGASHLYYHADTIICEVRHE